jgi:8-oxo-dGTP pyrophosphatase MutT (NUDIX family)
LTTSGADPLAEARAALARYVARFPDECALVQALTDQLAHDDDILLRSNMRGHVTTSALVLDSAFERALVIHHRVFDVWLQPGGHYEPPGSLWESARREVMEETGLRDMRPLLEEPIDIDTHPIPARPGRTEAAHWHHDFAYLAVAEGTMTLTPQIEEVHAVGWVPLGALTGYPNARLRRLAAKAQRAIAAAAQ